MDLAINILSSGGAKVLLLTTPCFAPQEQPDGAIWPFDDPSRVTRYNQLLRQAAARHPGVASIADLDAQFCPTNTYSSTVGGVVARTSDGIHISEAGGKFATASFAPQILALGAVHRAAEARTTVANQAHAPAAVAGIKISGRCGWRPVPAGAAASDGRPRCRAARRTDSSRSRPRS